MVAISLEDSLKLSIMTKHSTYTKTIPDKSDTYTNL